MIEQAAAGMWQLEAEHGDRAATLAVTGGRSRVVHDLTPAQCRELAAALLQAATTIEQLELPL